MSTPVEQPLPAPKTSGLAIASLVTALTCLSPAAIICGHMALSKIKKSGGEIGGHGIALAGTIVGYIVFAITLLSIVPIVFIGARGWKTGSDRAACIIMQRNIETAVRDYQISNGLEAGDPLDFQAILAVPGNETLNTACPLGGELIISPTVPEDGMPAVSCSNPEHTTY